MTDPLTPTTEAGRRLFTDMEPMDMWESDGVTPADILAIEQEARADTAALVKAARELVDYEREHPQSGGVGARIYALRAALEATDE